MFWLAWWFLFSRNQLAIKNAIKISNNSLFKNRIHEVPEASSGAKLLFCKIYRCFWVAPKGEKAYVLVPHFVRRIVTLPDTFIVKSNTHHLDWNNEKDPVTIHLVIPDFFLDFVVGGRAGKSGLASVLVPSQDTSDICHHVGFTWLSWATGVLWDNKRGPVAIHLGIPIFFFDLVMGRRAGKSGKASVLVP